MPILKFQQLKAGMTVSKDVMNAAGELFNGSTNILLIRRDTILTERHLQVLETWGIGEVEIAGELPFREHDPIQQTPPEVLEHISARLKARFYAPNEKDAVFQGIFQVLMMREVNLWLRSQNAHDQPKVV